MQPDLNQIDLVVQNGNHIGLMSPSDPSRRTAPPEI
jgi:hypothetical protein